LNGAWAAHTNKILAKEARGRAIGSNFPETGQREGGGPNGQRLSGCMKQMVV